MIQETRSRRVLGLEKVKEKTRPKNLREHASNGHKWAEKHARIGFWVFQRHKQKIIGSKTYARVGFGPTEKEKHGPKTYASVLLAARHGLRSTLA